MDLITLSLGLSLHLGFKDTYNWFHPHVRYHNESFISGIYFNSEKKISTYIGQRLEYQDFGIEYGAVTGYDYDNPVVPYLRGTYKDIFVSPAMEDDRLGVVIGTEFKF